MVESKIQEAKAFVPKENTKIDYKPESLGDKGYFVTAVVSRADKVPKEKGDKSNTPNQYNLKIGYNLEGQAK